MSFEIVPPTAPICGNPLGEGETALGCRGVATFRAEDLAAVGITNYAVVLADAGTLRIAVRAPAGKEERPLSVAVWNPTRKGKPDCQRRRISLTRALRRLSLTPNAVVGRYELTTKGAGAGTAMLIINLVAADAERQSHAGGAK